MREVSRHKLVATSLCAGPRRIAWADAFTPTSERSRSGCLCGSAERHYAQFSRCDAAREHVA